MSTVIPLSQVQPLLRSLLAGRSREEIAAEMSLTPRRVGQLIRAVQPPARHGNYGRLVAAIVRKTMIDRLDRLAGQAECSRADMASRLITAALESGPGGAERLLGRWGRRRRSYRPRGARVIAEQHE